MGGSGGGGSSYRLNPRDLAQLRQEAQDRLERTRLDAEINGLLQRLLVEINDRDAEAMRERLNQIEEALRREVNEIDRLLFGGSIAKHTWVDGLSDVDSLVILDPAEIGDSTPDEMRRQFESILRRRLDLGDVDEIRVGRMAVTVKYRDGMEVQLLPAVERGDSLAVSSPSGRDWASIDPRRFSERLKELNSEQAGAVVPAIKVAKAILAGQFDEHDRPTGYHVEALAIAAFADYDGPRTPKAMAQRFFERAAEDVLRPIADVSGQSRFVDADLGDADSTERRRLARNLSRVGRAMQTATSVGDWKSLIE